MTRLPKTMTSNMVLIPWSILAIVSLGLTFVDGEAQNMARPTRPKVFTNANELKKYLELIKEYYTLNGKARYGKRDGVTRGDLDRLAYSHEPQRIKLNIVEHVFRGLKNDKVKRRQQQLQHQDYLHDNGELIKS